jgi:ribosome modulation factor
MPDPSSNVHDEGRDAALQGRPLCSNPYGDDGLRSLWEKGWRTGQRLLYGCRAPGCRIH